MKENGRIPSYDSLYDKELINTVAKYYAADIKLYTEKFGVQPPL
ncbi:MAG: hypothetical protein U9N39_05600 [Campylobacterota bacterium]|nr:hypothetical protein [Campylobacterota bacterium]